MNQRYDDQNFSRHERDRDWDRERERSQRHEHGESQGAARASFYPGDYGSEESQYGQREPYTTSGSGGGSYGAAGYGQYRGEGQGGSQQGRDYGRSYAPEEYARYYERGSGQSRYSESQYGQRSAGPSAQERYGRGYGGEDREQQRYRSFGERGSPRYGSQGYDPRGNEGFYSDQQRYFGTGYSGEGGSGFGGGYGEDRWRRSPSGAGQFRAAESGRYPGTYGESHAGEPRQGLLQRMFHRGPKGYQRSDERLREDISERLMQADDVDPSEVTVVVASGKVTLEGTVPDRYMKHYIEDLVDMCPGVQDIDNRVRVDRGASDRNRGSSSGSSSASAGTTSQSSVSPSGTSQSGQAGSRKKES